MARLNEFLLERTRGEKYATVFYCILDASGLLSYSNAGHCAPFLVSPDGRLRTLNTTSMPVGMLEDAPFQMLQRELAPGDKLVIYSDGLTEAEDADGAFFDTERLRAVPARKRRAGCRRIARRAAASGGSVHRRRHDSRRHHRAGDRIRAAMARRWHEPVRFIRVHPCYLRRS